MDVCCLQTVASTKIFPLTGVSREHKVAERISRVYRKSNKKINGDVVVVRPTGDCPTLLKIRNPSQNGGGDVERTSNGLEGMTECKSSTKWVSQNRSKTVHKEVTSKSRGGIKVNGGGEVERTTNGSVHFGVEGVNQTKPSRRKWVSQNRSKSKSSGESFSEEKRETKSSARYLSYGGCLPLILQALDTIKDLDEALRPWEEKLNKKEMTIILKEQVTWERALEIFNWFKRKGCYELNVIHYNIMLRILGIARRWDYVEGIWNEMQASEVAPTNSTYGTLIDVYSKGGFKEEALLWLKRMDKQGMEPDEVTMGIVVQTYKKSGEFEKAEQFFKQWSAGKQVNGGGKTTDNYNISSEHKVCLSSHTYNTLIDTYGKAGQLQEASATFSQMLSKGIAPTTVTFNTMIHICGNNGHLKEVAVLMKRMEDLRCPPNTRTYNILISLHVKHDDMYAAASYYSKMKADGLKPDCVTYRTLIYAFSVRHMVSEAEALISEMYKLNLKVDEYTQSALTRMFVEVGMLQKAWSWFQRYHLDGLMGSECYSANIDAFGKHGHVMEAENAFIFCQQVNRLSVLEFNVMIKAYGIGKRYDKACELFDSMEKHDVLPDKCSYNSLIQILSSADLPHLAKPYVRRMQEAGLVLDCVPHCAVISSFVKLGQLDMAEEHFKEMVEFGVQPDIILFGILINAFADVGSVETAMTYVHKMESSGLLGNPVIYNSLIKLYTKVGYLQEAEETYRLVRSAEANPEVYSSNCMIDLYGERGLVTQAEEIFEELKQKGSANEFSYAMMLCMYRRVGKSEEAIAIANRMRELGLLTANLSYNNVIGVYAADGRLNEAIETFWEMVKSNIQPDDSTFRSLGAILVRCGASKEAVSKLEMTRRSDSESGLQAWMKTLWSMICVDKDAWKTSCPYELNSFTKNVGKYEVRWTVLD